MNGSLSSSPVVPLSRLSSLDFLRGLAVLGLLLMNAPLMGVSEMVGYLPFEPEVASDSLVRALNSLFFDGRFRSLFCLLFGIGLYLQSKSYQNKGLNSYVILKSRMKWLFLFGFIHSVFIWYGDVLMLYAMCGAVILGRLEEDAETLIKKGIIWFVIGFVVLGVVTGLSLMAEPMITRDSESYQQALALTKSGYFSDWQNNLMIAIALILTFPFLSLFHLCGVMLLGIGLFKSGKLTTGFAKSEVYVLLTVTVIVSLIDATLAVFYLNIWSSIANVLGALSGLTMALLIWHVIVISKLHERAGVLVTAIRRVGEMALTFYILQSVIVTVLLQVIFQQWLESFSLLNYMLLSFSVMALQLIIAYLYKRPSRQGPLEFIWRKLVSRTIIRQQKRAEV